MSRFYHVISTHGNVNNFGFYPKLDMSVIHFISRFSRSLHLETIACPRLAARLGPELYFDDCPILYKAHVLEKKKLTGVDIQKD